MKRFLLSLLFWLTVGFSAYADEEAKPILFSQVEEGSKLAFEVDWDGEVITGQFKQFEVEALFHPEMLSESRVHVTIHLDSVSVDNSDVQTTLPEAEWFHTEMFPKAIFVSEAFTFLKENEYQAKGNLTLKGTTLPVMLMFQLDEFSSSRAVISGTATLSRTDFGIGWKNTNDVSDEVKVSVRLTMSQ